MQKFTNTEDGGNWETPAYNNEEHEDAVEQEWERQHHCGCCCKPRSNWNDLELGEDNFVEEYPPEFPNREWNTGYSTNVWGSNPAAREEYASDWDEENREEDRVADEWVQERNHDAEFAEDWSEHWGENDENWIDNMPSETESNFSNNYNQEAGKDYFVQQTDFAVESPTSNPLLDDEYDYNPLSSMIPDPWGANDGVVNSQGS